MRSTKFALVSAALVLIPHAALGWGKLGHRASSAVAEKHLNAAARAKIRELLEPGESLADASTWADDEKSRRRRSSAWHYVNVPITEPRYDARFCPSTGCVVSKIEEMQATLKSDERSRDDRRRALRFLIHLVADLHQPCHVGDRGDRGGNDLQLRFFGVGTNLHRLWDTEIVEHHSTDESRWIAELETYVTHGQHRPWGDGAITRWADESLITARRAYSAPGMTPLEPGTVLGQEYFEWALPVARMRLAQAAFRLSTMLNALFG